MRRSASAVALIAIAACSGADAEPVAGGDEVRIEFEALTDLSTPIPDDVTGLELGEMAPTAAPFCDVVASTPPAFLGGALIPQQYFVDAFAAATDVPDDAAAPLRRLVDRGRRILIYRLRGTGEPVFVGEDGADDLLELIGVAVERCPGLPGVLGAEWNGEGRVLSADECDERRQELDAAIDGYRDRVGAEPLHAAQVEAENLRAASRELDVHTFVVLGDHAVEVIEGRASAVAVRGGRCDSMP